MAEDNIKNKESPVLLGIIPARGASKGIKNKNLRTVLNKPLIYYMIKDALSYKKIYKIIVTTDSLYIDIDEEDDLKLLEAFWESRKKI